MTRVLVTGGCGFVGVPVVAELLGRGDSVVVIDDFSRGRREALNSHERLLAVIEGDIRDQRFMAQACQTHDVEAVVHLAALHFIPHCDEDPQRCLSINVEGTQNVLDSVLRSRSVRGLVFASTAAVYAPDEQAHDENSRLAPTDVYGLSKLAGEQLVCRASDRYEVPVGIARLFNVYGPGETNPHLVPAVIQQAQAGERLALGNLSTARDYVFTDDVARGLTALLDASLAGKSITCNLGTGEARRGDDVVAAVGELVERRLVVDTDPERVRQSDRPVLQADSSRALDLLDWSPRVSFAEGLQATRHHVMQ